LQIVKSTIGSFDGMPAQNPLLSVGVPLADRERAVSGLEVVISGIDAFQKLDGSLSAQRIQKGGDQALSFA
jgi:hypothetical protein